MPFVPPLVGGPNLRARDLVTKHETDDYDRALAALRRLLPATLTADDPTPHRDVVFGVHASEITGRCSVSNHTHD